MMGADQGQDAAVVPQVMYGPDAEHALETRRFQGIPSLAVTPEGRTWVTWYAGKTPAEDQNNYVVIASSDKAGREWTEHVIIDPDGEGPLRAFDPQLWMDPTGRLWSIWSQTVEHKGLLSGVWAMTNDQPERTDSRWSAPRRLMAGVMMCKPVVLSSGEWVLPVSTWRETDNSARMMVSTDAGETWTLRGACHVPAGDRSYDEHMIVERLDGTLWMLVRTIYGIGESVSGDWGKSWSPLESSAIQHTSSRFFIYRLASGSLLLVKHGPIAEKTSRSRLTAYVSGDDGRNWSEGLMLDDREDVSYPDGQQGPDAAISIVYDRSRRGEREILLCRFTEEDVLAGRCGTGAAVKPEIVSRPSAKG